LIRYKRIYTKIYIELVSNINKLYDFIVNNGRNPTKEEKETMEVIATKRMNKKF